jgi:hypothetical protein
MTPPLIQKSVLTSNLHPNMRTPLKYRHIWFASRVFYFFYFTVYCSFISYGAVRVELKKKLPQESYARNDADISAYQVLTSANLMVSSAYKCKKCRKHIETTTSSAKKTVSKSNDPRLSHHLHFNRLKYTYEIAQTIKRDFTLHAVKMYQSKKL